MTSRRSMPTLAVLCLAVCGLAAGQTPTFVISPDTGPPGTPRTITVTAPPTAAISIPFPSCLYWTVHAGGCGSPAVPVLLALCSPATTAIQPCGTLSHSVDQFLLNGLAPGTYWMLCRWSTPTGPLVDAWADFRIDSSNEPTLTAAQPQTGQPWVISLAHPSDPAAGYIAAASFTTDAGIAGPGFLLTLDQDFLFNLSFPVPDPLIFSNFVGGLDAVGNATLAMQIPPIPSLSCIGLHVQAALLSPGSPLALSNCIDETIQ